MEQENVTEVGSSPGDLEQDANATSTEEDGAEGGTGSSPGDDDQDANATAKSESAEVDIGNYAEAAHYDQYWRNIEKAKDFLDKDVITQEDYDNLKSKMLRKIEVGDEPWTDHFDSEQHEHEHERKHDDHDWEQEDEHDQRHFEHGIDIDIGSGSGDGSDFGSGEHEHYGTGSGDGIETDHFGSGSGHGSDFGSGEHEHYGTGSGDEMGVEAIPGDMP